MVTRAVDPPDAARTHLGGNYISSRGDPERLPLSEERAIRALLVGDRDIGVREGLVDHGGTIHIEQHIFGYLGLPLSGLRGPASGQGLRGGRFGKRRQPAKRGRPGNRRRPGKRRLGKRQPGKRQPGNQRLRQRPWPLQPGSGSGSTPALRRDGRTAGAQTARSDDALSKVGQPLVVAGLARPQGPRPRSNRFNHDPTSSPPNSRRSSPSSSSTSSTGPWTTATSSATRSCDGEGWPRGRLGVSQPGPDPPEQLRRARSGQAGRDQLFGIVPTPGDPDNRTREAS